MQSTLFNRLVLVLISCLIPTLATAQSDTTLAFGLYEEGLAQVKEQLFRAAGEKFKQAAEAYKAAGYVARSWEVMAKAGTQFIESQDYPMAEKVLLHAYEESQKALPDSAATQIIVSKVYGDYLYHIGLYEQAVQVYNHVLEREIQLYGAQDKRIGVTYNALGNCLGYGGHQLAAKEHYLKALENSKANFGDDHPMLAVSYNNLGIFFYNQGDYALARQYYIESLDIRLQRFGVISRQSADSYNNIGNVYYSTGKYDSAQYYYQRTLDIYLKVLDANDLNIGYTYMNLGIIQAMTGNLDKAEDYFKKDLGIRRAKYGRDHPLLTYCYDNLGVLYQMQNRLDAAADAHRTSIKIGKINYGMADPLLAKTYADLGQLFRIQYQYDSALIYVRKALVTIKAWENNGFAPAAQITDYPKAIDMLELLTKIQLDYARQDSSLEMLVEAGETFWYLALVSDYMRQNYRAEQSRFHWQSNLVRLFEKGINLHLELNEKLGDAEYQEKAFLISERVAAISLFTAMNESMAATLLPEDLQLFRDRIIQEQNFYERELQRQTDSLKRLEYRNKLFQVRLQHDSLMEVLAEKYPDYNRMKYRDPNVPLKQLQQSLQTDQTLLEYFVGDSAIFAFVLNQDALKTFRIERDFPLNQWVVDFRKGLTQYHLDQGASEQQYVESLALYRSHAFGLYQKLIMPLEKHLKSRLTIIPQGELGYIPFEALLIDTLSPIADIQDYAFLLNQHSISYAYASHLTEEMKQVNVSAQRQSLLALAPGFEEDSISKISSRRFGPLPHSKLEVETIQKFWPGKVVLLSGEEASARALKELASSFRILHIATHGQANDQNPEQAYLAFSGENNVLYLPDLAQLSLGAELVVLSACETGVGPLARGEGIVSLARSFAFAGTRSLVSTLWQVNDTKTAQYMELFYNGLLKGMPKDLALNQAKREYIATQDDYYAHPFFWAPYIGIGDMRPLEQSAGLGWMWYLLVGMGLIGFIYWIYRRSIGNPK